jgi:hypothetical protein
MPARAHEMPQAVPANQRRYCGVELIGGVVIAREEC